MLKPLSRLIVLLAWPLFLPLCSAEISTPASQPSSIIWAFGDVHGAYDELVAILQSASLIDAQHNWSGGTATLISTGDLIDRGTKSRKVLELMMQLTDQAKAAGGQVKLVLGNHEVMALVGNLEDVTTEEIAEFQNDETPEMRARYFQLWLNYQQKLTSQSKAMPQQITQQELQSQFDLQYPAGLLARLEAFSPQGKYGQWLSKKPFLLVDGQNIFTHSGLSPALQEENIDSLNAQLQQQLDHYIVNWHQFIHAGQLPVASSFEERQKIVVDASPEQLNDFQKSQEAFLFSNQSPIWYRGAVYCHPYYEQTNIDRLLKQFNAERLFVGHVSTENHRVNIALSHVYLMDTGMLKSFYHGNASILKIEPQNVQVFEQNGTSYEAMAVTHRTILYPPEIPFNELEDLLKYGKITKIEKLHTGITEPLRLTFDDPRAKVRAIFKYIDSAPGIEDRRERNITELYADRYHYDIAAYRLSEMLGLHLVPLSVEREIDGVKGVVQYWIEDSDNEYSANQKGWTYDGDCDYQAQVNLMNVFDLLVFNNDRNPTNVVIERHQNQLLWIDHSRSFSNIGKLPEEISHRNIVISPEFRKALQNLDAKQLTVAMQGLLNRGQIKSLLRRRNRILRLDSE